MKIEPTGKYQKMLDELKEKSPELTKEIDKRVSWFKKNPSDTRLNTHSLGGKLEGKWAFSITGDI